MTLTAKHFAGKSWKGLPFDKEGLYKGEVPQNLRKIMSMFGIEEVKETKAEEKPASESNQKKAEVKNG